MTNRCRDCGKFVKKNQIKCDSCKGVPETLDSQKVTIDENTMITNTVARYRPLTLAEHVEFYEVDTQQWYAKNFKGNNWDVTTKEGITYTNYQFKVTWERKKEVFCFDEIKKDFINNASKHVPKNYKHIKYDFDSSKKRLLEINIADLHLGKLAWAGETGENYDIKIAVKRFRKTLQDLVTKATVFGFNRILFTVGNDFFNSDNLFNETTYGTKQDEDLRWQKTYKIGRELLVEGIDYLRSFSPVDVVIIPGNHDFQRMFYIGDSLELWYSKCNEVTVNNQAIPRKYYSYGNLLLCLTHGKDEKEGNLPLLMAQESPPELWAKAKFKEIHLGHLHHKKEIKYQSTKEYNGIVVRYMRSLCGTEEWHFRKGFTQNIKGAEAFIWSDTKGLDCYFEVNLDI